MTTATLHTRSMAFNPARRAPLLQRVWDSMVAAGARRAAADLRREATLRADTDPALARQMLAAAESITTK